MTTGADYDAALRTQKEIEARIESKIRDLGPAGEYLRYGAWRQYSVVFRSLSPNMSQNRPPLGRGPGFAEVEALLPEFGRAVSASVNAWNRLQSDEKRGRKRPL